MCDKFPATYQRVRRCCEVAVHRTAAVTTASTRVIVVWLLVMGCAAAAALVLCGALQTQLHLELLHKEPFVEHVATSCQQRTTGAAAVGIDYGAHYPRTLVVLRPLCPLECARGPPTPTTITAMLRSSSTQSARSNLSDLSDLSSCASCVCVMLSVVGCVWL